MDRKGTRSGSGRLFECWSVAECNGWLVDHARALSLRRCEKRALQTWANQQETAQEPAGQCMIGAEKDGRKVTHWCSGARTPTTVRR